MMISTSYLSKTRPFLLKLQSEGFANFEGGICGHVLLQPGGYWWQCSLAYSSGIEFFISDLNVEKPGTDNGRITVQRQLHSD